MQIIKSELWKQLFWVKVPHLEPLSDYERNPTLWKTQLVL